MQGTQKAARLISGVIFEKEHMIKSLEQYIAEVNKINENWNSTDSTTHAWYRGQSDFLWDLEPSIYRENGTNDTERELIRDFKLNASRFINHLPESDFGWLYFMQHYGVPTRLIDWTESYLVAIYFAVLNFNKDSDGVVWLIKPWSLNENNISQQSVPVDSHPKLNEYLLNTDPERFERRVKGEYPVAIRPNRVSPRIIAQKGVFTIHGCNTTPLNKLGNNKKGNAIVLEKIKICGKSKLKILKELHMAGISHSVLFPEMEGLAKEISFRYSIEYLNSTNNSHHHKGF
jgi:hypothetical protein